jgi:hypothetical protein
LAAISRLLFGRNGGILGKAFLQRSHHIDDWGSPRFGTASPVVSPQSVSSISLEIDCDTAAA